MDEVERALNLMPIPQIYFDACIDHGISRACASGTLP
jgi:hypothetical protein